MKFLYQYPEPRGRDAEFLAAGPVAAVARAVEDHGWHGMSFTEHPAPGSRWMDAGGHQTLDPFVALGHAAAVTQRIRLLTNLSVAPYRNPLLLAKAAATVDVLSAGRMILGLGTGYLKSEFHALGVDFEDRNRAFDETLDVLAMHWSGEPFDHVGAGFEARDTVARPRPVQRPIPVWIGGNAARTRRRVAERAQGWLPLTGGGVDASTVRTPALAGTGDLADKIAEVRDAAGPRGASIDVAVAYTALDQARPDADVDAHRSAFADLERAGVTWVVVPGTTDTPSGTEDFLATFGSAHCG